MKKNNSIYRRVFYILIVIFGANLISGNGIYAQSTEYVCIDSSASFKNNIIRKSQSINNLSCSFESHIYDKFSKKKINSTGDLFFRKPQKLLWQYLQPESYYISVDEKGTLTNQFGSEQEYEGDVEFDILNMLIVEYYNGSIFSIKKYEFSYYQNDYSYIIRLIPITESNNTNIINIEISVNSIDMGLIGIRIKYSNNMVSNYVFRDRMVNGETH